MEAEDLAALLNEYLAALETTTPRPKPGRVEFKQHYATISSYGPRSIFVDGTQRDWDPETSSC